MVIILTQVQVYSGFLYCETPNHLFGLKKERTWQCFSTGIIIIYATPPDSLQISLRPVTVKITGGKFLYFSLFFHSLGICSKSGGATSAVNSSRAKNCHRAKKIQLCSFCSFTNYSCSTVFPALFPKPARPKRSMLNSFSPFVVFLCFKTNSI